ncbi:histidine kinase [Paenibacillus alginolyticus]|uniref:histidine kinase n=1 Tax=Paenibacillus alginolyticus TaxID=59839 RepID=A0ABT4GBP6_9BACL|nr:histidine kinase [Paenibacillus alginolyticus]MCY9666192.1 histidine kinase [Paenibacillus alginolyticus]MCY9693620.1 histidine kinase [Paenibacillus alginolyticus]MEC0142345.1 histidine kinase [Paenibacillus alginolyticus]
MAVFSILLILPFAALAYILSEEATKTIKASIESSTAQTIEQFASHVVTLLTQVEDTGNQVVSSRTTQEWLTVHLNPDNTIQERVLTKQRLREYFSSYAVNNSNGISISAFAEDAGGLWTQDRSYKNSEWFTAFMTEGKRWTTAHKDIDQSDEFMRARSINSFLFPLVQLQSLKNVGFIKVNYPTTLLRNAIEKIRVGKTGKVILLTSEGNSVLDQDISEDRDILRSGLEQIDKRFEGEISGIFPIEDKGSTNLLFFRKLPAQNWTIVGTVPEGELYEKITHIRQTMLLVTALLLILAMLAAFWLSAGITKPLSVMGKAMKHVQRGEFNQALHVMPKVREGHSEVDYVTGVFEQMTHRLRYLIETEFETNLRRKNAEYKALLLQINPHFYNNTLEIISGLAAMKREDLVMDATEALGKMMRYSLNLNSDLVRVAEEMSYIRDYLFILHLRHEARLQVVIEEDPAAKDFMIAKFIIQPLVENAVKYSLEKDGVAQVTLRTQVLDDRLLICVKDNGIGMSPELVQDLLTEIKTGDSVAILSSEGQSIGLRNVLSRCRLNYGEQFHLGLHSRLGEGTEMTLYLPLLRS